MLQPWVACQVAAPCAGCLLLCLLQPAEPAVLDAAEAAAEADRGPDQQVGQAAIVTVGSVALYAQVGMWLCVVRLGPQS